MGGASSLWYSKDKRKVLIMSFEEFYTQMNKNITINEGVGFFFEKIDYNYLELGLWFLTSKNRHLWRHHYLGSQGIILIFSFKECKKPENILNEIMNIFTDSILSSIPILILFDTTNSEDENLINLQETFRKKINLLENKHINTQYINFERRVGDLALGLDWLCEVMQPI